MTDTLETTDQQAGGGCLKRVAVIGLALLALIVGLLVILTMRARAVIAENVARVKKADTELEARDASRPVIFGARQPGNSVWHYQALEWILSPRESWTSPPAHMPPSPYGKNHFAKDAVGISVGPNLLRLVESRPGAQAEWARLYGKKPEKAPKAKDAKAARDFYQQHGVKLLAILDGGFGRAECDWQLKREDGLDGPLPNLLLLRFCAQLLAYRAQLGDEREAVESSLKIVALGRDVRGIPGLIGGMMAAAIRSLGYQSLERALRRPLNRSQCRRIIESLNKLGTMDFKQLLLDEQVCQGYFFGRLGGYGKPVVEGNSGLDGLVATNSIILAREWETCNALWDQALTNAGQPFKESRKAEDSMKELTAGFHPLAGLIMPNFAGIRKHVIECNAFHDCCLIGAAAKLHRLETGKWPGQVEELKKVLGEIPKDPYTDRSKPYEIKAEGLNFVVKTRDKGQDFDRTIAIRVRAAK